MDSIRFGTYTEFQCPPGADHAQVIRDHLTVGQHADTCGFEVFTCLEHPFFEQFAIMPAPLPLFCTLAERTRNLTFRAMCHTLPLHNPMVLAGELATADILLDGRFEIGVGRGHAWLNAPANIEPAENRERYAEALDILVQAWTGERFSYHGKHYQVDDLQVVPTPLQRPHPRIYQVGTSAKWFPRAVENDYGIVLGGPVPTAAFREPARVYHELCAKAGATPHLGWIKAIWIHEDADTALREAREPIERWARYNISPLASLARSTPEEKQRLIDAGYGFYASDLPESFGRLSFDEMLEQGIACVGTPEQVGAQLLELWQEFRFEELLVISQLGGCSASQSIRSQELFSQYVMPMLREAVAGVPAPA
jgi:alkanesulfonate monooxygenase SsuD/methylene tetrahydromethanopterin reductase-like flavin-dependent oxidoreductase (luciferase family)